MIEEKESLRKQHSRLWFLSVIFCSLVSFSAHAAQSARDLKEIKVAYPPSMASV